MFDPVNNAGYADVSEDDIASWVEADDGESDGVAEGENEPATKYADSQLRVVRETKDWQLDYLQIALHPERSLIDLKPSYQRRDRWSRKKSSLLVESFIMNIPVPPIFLFEQDYNSYEVVDGRQRLEALRGFLNNEWSLTGMEFWGELDGCRFSNLPLVIQKGLMRRSLSAVILMAETNLSNTSTLDVRRVLFDRLNTGGVKLNPQELRNALYPGRLNILLHELAATELFTTSWGIPKHPPFYDPSMTPPPALIKNAMYAQMADTELVLRFFALREALEEGRGGALRTILDRYMANNANLSDDLADSMKSGFNDSLSYLVTTFQGAPFTLPGSRRRSRPLYDALMIAASSDRVERASSSDIRSAMARALADPEKYDVLVGRGNTVDAIRARVDLAQEVLKGKAS